MVEAMVGVVACVGDVDVDGEACVGVLVEGCVAVVVVTVGISSGVVAFEEQVVGGAV